MKKASICLIVLVIGSFLVTGSSAESLNLTEIFPEIPELPKIGAPQRYAPENLYQYINGAAEVYLSYGFQELVVQEYENAQGQFVTVEMYRHDNPTNGFGIYSQERPVESDFLNIGAQGYYENGVCNFVSGSYYVRLTSFNLGEDEKPFLTTLASQLAGQLEEHPQLPAILAYFPQQGKIKNSERFILQDVLGYAFLQSAFTADYEVSGTSFQIVIITCADQQACATMLTQYLAATNTPYTDAQPGTYAIKDPYHGTMTLTWKDKYIWGIKGLDDSDMASTYLQFLEKHLSVSD